MRFTYYVASNDRNKDTGKGVYLKKLTLGRAICEYKSLLSIARMYPDSSIFEDCVLGIHFCDEEDSVLSGIDLPLISGTSILTNLIGDVTDFCNDSDIVQSLKILHEKFPEFSCDFAHLKPQKRKMQFLCF